MSRTTKLWLAGAAVGAAAASGTVVAALTSNHESDPVVTATLLPLVGLSFLTAGLFAWTRRPENGTGRLMVTVGLLWFVNAFFEANNHVVYTIAAVAGSLFFGAFVHLLLAYPRGRLETTTERRAVPGLYAIAFLAGFLPALFDPGHTHSCGDCPPTDVQITPNERVTTAIQDVFTVLGAAIFLCVVVLVIRRWRHATPARRRLLGPVYLAGGITLGLVTVGFGADIASTPVSNAVGAAAFTSFALLPAFFLAGILRTHLQRAAVARLAMEMPDDATPAEAQAGLRRALRDPTLRLFTWVEDEGIYFDVEGNEFDRLPSTPGRRALRIDHEGGRGPLAAVTHDVALAHEPELLEEVLAVARLALEKDRGLKALRRSEARNRALIDALPDLMFRISRDGTYLAFHGDPADLVVPPDELVGANIREVLPGEVAAAFVACLRSALEGRIATTEYSLEIAGVRRDFEARMVPSGDDEVVVIVRDFTERSRLENELQDRLIEIEREQQFVRTVVNTAPVVFLIADTEGRIVRFNQTCEQLFGHLDDDSVRGKLFWDVYLPPEHHGRARSTLERLRRGERLVEGEGKWLTADGGYRIMQWQTTPIVDGRGRDRFLVSALDVTERIRQQEELRQRRDLLDVIAKATPSMMAVVDGDGTVAEEGVNQAFHLTTGYGDAEAVGHRLWDLVVPPELALEFEADFRRTIETGDLAEHETAWIGRTGEWRVVAWTSRPLALGKRPKYLISGVDVTERKRQEAEVRASRARIVEATDAARRKLERNLHDGAQQRLVSLSLALRLAQSKLRDDPGAAERVLTGASEELSHALEELRELARGIHPAVLTDRGLGPALEALAGRAPLPVELSTELEERLPAPVEAAAYYVVAEALTNVVKYADASAVQVRAAREDGRVVVEVADDGVGGADPYRGSGLRGLADRVEALDGRLDLESGEGEGTTLRAVIPVREATPR